MVTDIVLAEEFKPLDINQHLEVQFEFCTAELAENFRDQKSRPELTVLYNLMSDFGAHIRSNAKYWDKDQDFSVLPDPILEAMRSGPNAERLIRVVSVSVPDDNNLKTLYRNLSGSPAFVGVIDQKSVEIQPGASYGDAGYFDGAGGVVMFKQPDYQAPPHPPAHKGFCFT